MWFLFFLFVAAPAARAQALDPDAERIMEVQFIDGNPISDALSVYNQENDWFFPLQEFSAGLGLQLQVSGELGRASGYILREDQSFKLESTKDGACHVWIRREERPCPALILKGTEIWVGVQALEAWFPLKLHIDSFGSHIDIETLEPFPAQARKERERQAALNLRHAAAFDPGYPREKIPQKSLDGFSLDQQLAFTHEQAPSSSHESFSHDTAASWETLGFESKAFITGQNGALADPRLSFARRDPEGKLLGKLRASEIELWDFSMPTVNLVGGGGLSRGAQISSYPLSSSTEFQTTDVSGELPTGWEVELYQNGNLIGREVSSNQGRYIFTGIPLEYGSNQFRLLFYGPQGQRREEFKTYNVDASIAKPGRSSYRLSVGKNRELNKPQSTRTQLLWEKNLFGALSFRGGWLHNIPTKEASPLGYYLTGVRGFHKGLFYYSDAAFSQNHASAWETGLKEELWGVNLGLSHTLLNNFVSDVFERQDRIKYQTKVSAGFNFFSQPTLRMNFDFLRKILLDRSKEYNLANRISTQTGPLYWFNELNYVWGEAGNSSWTGKLTNFFLLGPTQVRMSGDYDKHRFTSLGLLLQQNFGDLWSLSGGATEDLQVRKTTYNLGVNRVFPWLTASLNNSYTTAKELSSALLVSYNLSRDSVNRELHVSAVAQSAEGSASVFVFVDNDRDGKFSAGDEAVKNATVVVNQQDWAITTDDAGKVFLSRLASYDATDISLALKSLEDPMLRPAKTGVRIYPRPGKTADVEIPVVYMGEVSGVIRDARNKGAAKLRVLAKDSSAQVVREAVTEADGFYLLENIPVGTYTLELAESDSKASPRNRSVTVGPKGGFIDNQDFQVP